MQRDDELLFKLLPPPAALPRYADAALKTTSYFGHTNFVSGLYRSRTVFGMKRVDRRRHIYLIGKSGMGKTRLLEQLIRYDVAANEGIGLIDPHGDLALAVLDFVPTHRIQDVVYVDPSDAEYPIAFNPFASVPATQRQNVAQGLVEIFKKQFMSSWSPRMEHLFRFATLAILEHPEGTLYELMRLLTDAQARQKTVSFLTDDVVKRFFAVEFAGFSQKYDHEAITPLTNRLGQFFADPFLRAIFTQVENKIDVADIMNNGKILIVNTSKGLLGEDNSSLLGAFFLTKINQVAMARSRVAEVNRREFYLYVDEFQNAATESFSSLFSESRKFAINITIANQYLAQIPPPLLEAIFGNVSTIISFRIGGSDSDRMAKEFMPLVQPQDLINLGVRDFYIKMSIDGQTAAPFSARTLDVMPVEHSNADAIIQNARHLYSSYDPNPEVFEEENGFESEEEEVKEEELIEPISMEAVLPPPII